MHSHELREDSPPRQRFEVVLRRANGRYVRSKSGLSKYAAKAMAATWEANHDDTYYVDVVPAR